MPFNTLLLSSCLIPGKTSYTEDGVTITLQPQNGETILFFSIDDQSNPNCKLRPLLGLAQAGMKICDLIVFYANDTERIICFVELKGSNIQTAKDQVINTFITFNAKLNSSLTFTAKTYIVHKGSTPQEIEKYKQELENKFGKGNYDINRDPDLGKFIRGTKYKSKGKRKGKKQ